MLVFNPDISVTEQDMAEAIRCAALQAPGVVIKLKNGWNDISTGRLVQILKELTDLALFALPAPPLSLELVEKVYACGFHGIVFPVQGQVPDKAGFVAVARRLFSPGALFLLFLKPVTIAEAKKAAAAGLVPLVHGIELKEVKKILATNRLEPRWLDFLGFYPGKGATGLSDKLVKKCLLEVANLKHTLRVSRSEESYGASLL